MSPEAEAIDLLRKFMCCEAGQDAVDEGLIRPFLHSLPYVPRLELETVEATGRQRLLDEHELRVKAEAEREVVQERLTTLRHITVARLCKERDEWQARAKKAETVAVQRGAEQERLLRWLDEEYAKAYDRFAQAERPATASAADGRAQALLDVTRFLSTQQSGEGDKG